MPPSESKLLFVIAAVQFINILDFMMVMPLGPDFAAALAISTADLGWVGGSYTASAALSGLACSLFLDRIDRKKALLWAMAGLFVATGLGALAYDFLSLLLTRIIAGAFGGPASAVALAIIADVVPVERRGAALGKVMGAFSVAAVVGVPFGLELSKWFGWQAPFVAVAGMGAVILCLSRIYLPSMRAHLDMQAEKVTWQDIWGVWKKKIYVMAFLTNSSAMAAGFMIIPNISAYVQYNLYYPREQLGLLYAAGGAVTFVVMRIAGKLLDKVRISHMGWIASFIVVAALYTGFIHYQPFMPPLVIFMLFMFGMAMRNVSMHTLASRVPFSHERAGFMSMLSSVQHLSSAGGAFIASRVLSADPVTHQLHHMPLVATIAAAGTFIAPLCMRSVEREFVKRQPQ